MTTAHHISPNSIVALPELHADAAGALVWWTLSGTVRTMRLEGAWVGAGLPVELLPPTASAMKALTRAAKEQADQHRLVRSTGSGHDRIWHVVDEKEAEGRPEYAVECSVRYDAGTDAVVVEPSDHPLAQDLRNAFGKHLGGELNAHDVSHWLCRLLDGVRAVSLRPSGGFYFVPRPSMERWRQFTGVLHGVSDHRCHEVPALPSAEAVDSILAALVTEVEAELKDIDDKMTGASLGKRARESRAVRCEALTDKITTFEGLLGRTLPELRDHVQGTRVRLLEDLIDSVNFGDE